MLQFDALNLPEVLRASLVKMNFTTPTPIQAAAIPVALEGKDILGSAQTGTGKTAAFSIPLVAKLLQNPRGSALVLTPTRELAVQVIDVIQQLIGTHSALKTALLIGGEPMPKQFQQLRARPRIIVGTPGRVNDHLERGTLMLHDAGMLVLDETDRMLDMGFGIQLDKILKFLPQQRQTLLFSATLPPQIVKLADKYTNNPQRIAAGATSAPATKVQQDVVRTSDATKYNDLLAELEKRTGSIIIFVKTKFGADKLSVRLNKQGHASEAIHGDLQQRKRDRVISSFRDKKYRILVATDVAARGLDIPHIEHVINYDLPQCPEDYIHRIGRTARAGAEGNAVSFITSDDGAKWRAIERLLNPGAKPERQEFDRDDRRKPRGRFDNKRSGGGFRGARTDRPERSEHRSENRTPRAEGRSEQRPERTGEQRFENRGPRPERAGEQRFERRAPRTEGRNPNFVRDGNRPHNPHRPSNPNANVNGNVDAGNDNRGNERTSRPQEANGNQRPPRREGERREGFKRSFNNDRRSDNRSGNRSPQRKAS